jgi:DNA-binding transcriptional ArsR family regulator
MLTQTDSNNAFKAKVLNALSDPLRLDIMQFLRDGEKCVCKIVPHLNLAQPIVSRHLRILREAGLVRCRKDGTKRLYSVTNPEVYDVIDALTPKLLGNLAKDAFENLNCCPAVE